MPIARFGRIWLYIAYSTSYFFHVDKTAAICGKLVGLFLKKPPPFRNRRGGNNPRKMKGVAAELTGGGVLLLPLLCFTPADRQTEEKEAERYLSEVVFLLCSSYYKKLLARGRESRDWQKVVALRSKKISLLFTTLKKRRRLTSSSIFPFKKLPICGIFLHFDVDFRTRFKIV